MTPHYFEGANVIYKAPPDWDAAKNGPCLDMHVQRTDDFAISRWWPSKGELDVLLAGGSVEVAIAGGQPAIAVRAV